MGAVWQELATSIRGLMRRPSLALGVTFTIGLGIGATTTIYGVVDGVILRPLPYEDPARLVAIGALMNSGPPDAETGLQPLVEMSSEVYKRYRERARSFTQVAGLDPFNLITSEENGTDEEIPAVRVSPELFDLLGAVPVLGRAFALEEYAEAEEAVAMISYEYWQSRYGGDPGVLGQVIASSPAAGPRPTIVGILPRGFQPPEAFSQAGRAPWVYQPLPTADPGPGRFIIFPVNAIGRLGPGATIEQAREEAERLWSEIQVELTSVLTGPGGARAGIGVNDLHVQTVGATGRTLWIFLGAAGLLLALTAMNAATLFLARALDRSQELGVRVALGAGRAAVVRLLLAEAGALSVVGGVLGVSFAYGGVAAFLRYAPTSIPRLGTIAVDARVLGAAAVMTLGTAIAAGLMPVLRFTTKAPWERLQSGGRSASEAASRLRMTLVGGQLALAVVLLSGAGLLFSSFLRLRSVDPGFEPDGLVAVGTAARGPMRIRIDGSTSPSQIMAQSWDRVGDALGSVLGATSAGMANALPFQTPTWAPRLWLPGDGPEVVREGIVGYVVSPAYLETLGARVIDGRGLEVRDGFDAELVIVVNEAFVRTQLEGRDAIGTMVTRTREGPGTRGEQIAMRIVGVIGDIVQARAQDGTRPAIYLPYNQADLPQLEAFWSVVRTDRSPEALAPEVRAALAATDRTPRTVATMDTQMSETRATPRFQTFLIGAFAAVAMLLAAAGLQGSLAHSVRRRQRELAVRMALGADRASVIRMVLAQGLRVSVAGLVIGLVGTLALSRVLASFLYEMEPYDPVTLLGVAAVLMLVSVLACLAPARRATAVDPVRVLQAE